MVARLVGVLLVASAVVTASEQQPSQVPQVEFKVEVLGTSLTTFIDKMAAYETLRRSLEEGLPPLAETTDPAKIFQSERLLAERIRQARAGARRGDIFTEDVRRAFRQLLLPVTNAGICEAVRDDNPGEFSYPINATYPKSRPFSTVPAALLAVLPRLPEDVWYRFLNRDLILHDSRANIILDRIDNAIRCGD
jgi:hypothetical protein